MFTITLSVSFYKKHHRIYDSFILEYIWIDSRGNLRSKYRTAYPKFESCRDGAYNYIPVENWNYDQASTHDNDNNDNETTLIPVAYYLNPFFESGRAFLILCETYNADGSPTNTNFRHDAEKLFESSTSHYLDPCFRINQEYFIIQSSATTNFVPLNSYETQPTDYYCGVGTPTVTLRRLAEKHYQYCLNAQLKISAISAETVPTQWQFQIGPSSKISASDELWVARYILVKLSEEFGVCICFKPKSLPNPSNSTDLRLHTSFSTQETRDPHHQNGLKCIYKYIDHLSKKHTEHIRIYGDISNRVRSGSDFHTFSFAYGDRNSSIFIPKSVLKAGCGYLEDRRPASDADPYRVTAAIFTTACLSYQELHAGYSSSSINAIAE